MGDYDYKVIENYGVIANHDGVSLELKKIKWGNNPSKYDLRAWINGYPRKGGITLTDDDMRNLKALIKKQNTSTLITNYVRKDKKVSKTDTKETKVTPEIKTQIIQFPKPKPEISKAVTNGNATYDDCVKKIEADKKVFVDADSQYVLDGILELCKVDADFRNNVMREDMNFTGALGYMADMCRQGYGYKAANYGMVDRDMGLGFAIDYFNSEPAPKTSVSNVTSKSSEPKKRGRKKKGE